MEMSRIYNFQNSFNYTAETPARESGIRCAHGHHESRFYLHVENNNDRNQVCTLPANMEISNSLNTHLFQQNANASLKFDYFKGFLLGADFFAGDILET